MWANKVIGFLNAVLYWPFAIAGLVTTFIGGILMGLPIVGLLFVLLLNLIWLPFLGVLLASAWCWHRGPSALQPLVAIVGIPVAVVGNTYLMLSPGGGDPGDMLAKHMKQVMCQHWPYANRTAEGESLLKLMQDESGKNLFGAIVDWSDSIARRDSPYGRYV